MKTLFLVVIMLIFLITRNNITSEYKQETFSTEDFEGSKLNKIQRSIDMRTNVSHVHMPHGKFYRRNCKINNLDENISYNQMDVLDKIQCSYAALSILTSKLNATNRLLTKVKRRYNDLYSELNTDPVNQKLNRYSTIINIMAPNRIDDAFKKLDTLTNFLKGKLPKIPTNSMTKANAWLTTNNKENPGFDIDEILYKNTAMIRLTDPINTDNNTISAIGDKDSIRNSIIQIFSIYLYIDRDLKEISKQL